MQNNSLRNTLCFAALGAALLLLLLLNIMLGSVSIPARQVLEILAHPGGSDTAARIIISARRAPVSLFIIRHNLPFCPS